MNTDKKKSILTSRKYMCKFPKIELHRHLEGTFDPATLYSIAKKNGLDVPGDFEEFKTTIQFPREEEPDFLLFLSKFRTDWYASHDDVEKIAYNSVYKMKEDGIFYIELRFSPEHFSLQNDFDRREITKLVIDAGNKAAKDAGFHIRYLITFNRNKQTPEEMISLYKMIKDLGIPEIVGIDLAGDEMNYPPELFDSFFSQIQSDKLYKATVHAGEVTDSDQIWTAVTKLHAKRIGHGTSSINDPKLQEYLKEHFIVLEQCITSNYQTGSWKDESNHPMGALHRNGVPVTINSDDPSIQNTDLTDDYIKAVTYFDFSLEDLVQLNLTALKATFLSGSKKQKLIDEYASAVKRFRQFTGL
ncbi:adenosine deaminase [Salinispira pacifica]|uniref:adenosine deaminase n=1 Tax=Salinispira pacifica TaxID=1307761 RepID=V5WMG1_9SPIO|nr:adenosine deaminase [Salinispira pacifica]AHC16840.1 Adenosine deaminase [Salinispira pacifica]